MTERSRNERKKIFVEIMESLNEYSTEEIHDRESVKDEILQLLKTHRPIKLSDYQYGLSINLNKDHRLIIKEPEDESKVREYMYIKHRKVWLCTNYGNKRYKCKSSSIQIVYGILFAPINHHENCATKDYSFVMKLQNLLKEGKTKEVIGLTNGSKKSRNNTSICSSSSLSNTLLNESTSSAADDKNEISITDESLSGNTTPTLSRTGVKREIKNEESDDDDCLVIDEPAAKKPKIKEKSNDDKVFEFHRPSTIFLKQICKKLKINSNEVYQNGYNFWANIIFHNIITVTNNVHTHSFKSSNFFACLSLLFTGKTDSCLLIQHVINSAFREDPNILGTKTSEEIEQLFVNSTVSDEQLEFIAKFLGCRIGIYYGKTLKKFGKWNQKEKGVITLILSFENGLFSVVLNID